MSATAAPPEARSKVVRREMERDVLGWCRAHVPEVSGDGLHIRFATPGTSVYSANFRISGGFLLVWGDVDDAVYRWGERLTWEFLRSLRSFDYFASKCMAHPEGRRARGWDGDVAWEVLQQYLDERIRDTLTPHELRDLEWASATREDWSSFLHSERADALLGDDWWDWAASIGDVPDLGMMAHWVMLREAVSRMASSGVRDAAGANGGAK